MNVFYKLFLHQFAKWTLSIYVQLITFRIRRNINVTMCQFDSYWSLMLITCMACFLISRKIRGDISFRKVEKIRKFDHFCRRSGSVKIDHWIVILVSVLLAGVVTSIILTVCAVYIGGKSGKSSWYLDSVFGCNRYAVTVGPVRYQSW